MKTINRNNKILYKYGNNHEMSDGVMVAIILYCISVLLLICSILISYIYLGEAPYYVAGIGIASIIFNTGSICNIILEIYLYKNFHEEIRNLLILQIVLYSIWIFII